MEHNSRKMRTRQRMNDHYHWLGLMTGLCFTSSFVLIIVAVTQIQWLIAPILFFSLAVPITTNLIMKGENIMITSIKKALGITANTMKLEAVANYLKVKFAHIPEHFECEKIKKGK